MLSFLVHALTSHNVRVTPPERHYGGTKLPNTTKRAIGINIKGTNNSKQPISINIKVGLPTLANKLSTLKFKVKTTTKTEITLSDQVPTLTIGEQNNQS